ncbi:MAG: hypothetical protein PHH26_00670 [Candidatus Thermoplasmatota archaeon]|nr:hypothetical protein [Candidatus Thermoplasmatota archaeon]
MTLTNTFDTNTPLGSQAPDVIDDRIRESKAAIQERMNDHNGVADTGDHYWPKTGTQVSDTDTGEHRKVTLRTLSAVEIAALDADKAVMYRSEVDGEYYFTDGAGNTIQITSGGLSLLGHLQVAKVGAYSLVAADLKGNKTFTNTGTTAVVPFTWPALAAGQKATFLVTDADGIRIIPPAGVSFYMVKNGASAAGKYIAALVVGSLIELESDGTSIYITNIGGVWTVES